MRQLDSAVATMGARIEWLSDDWIARIELGEKTIHIIGNRFPLNSATTDYLCNDKVATYVALSRAQVPAVPHFLIYFPWSSHSQVREYVSRLSEYSLVIKPLTGSGGKRVWRIDTEAELWAALATFKERERSVAICPYIEILDEYRMVLLEGNCHIAYRKKRNDDNPDEWRHNLCRGASPELVTDPHLYRQLLSLARSAAAALKLRFGCIDLVRSERGLSVLEVNSSVMLSIFSAQGASMYESATRVYAAAIARSLADVAPLVERKERRTSVKTCLP